MRTIYTLTVIAFLTASTFAAAQSSAVRTEKSMSLDLANQIATASVVACSANGYAVTATVLDRAGTVRAVQRADNAGPTPWPPASRRPGPRHQQRTPRWP